MFSTSVNQADGPSLRVYNPGQRKASNIDDATWQPYRDRIESWHSHDGFKMLDISTRLASFGFEPSSAQLRARMIRWGLVRGNKHLLGTKNAQNESIKATSSQLDPSPSSHNHEANAPYHDVAGTAELQGPAQDLFSDIIDIDMTEASVSTIEQVAVRGHRDSLEINDDEEGQNAYGHVGIRTSSLPVHRLDHLSGRSLEASVSSPSVVNYSCEYDSGFGPTLAPIHEPLEDLSIGSRQPRPIEPPVDCGPSPLMPWEGSQKSFGTSSYGEHSSGLFRHTTGMASGPPTPSDASFRTSILAASLSNGPARDARFFVPGNPRQLFQQGRFIAVARRNHASNSSGSSALAPTAENPYQDSLLTEDCVYLLIVVRFEGDHVWCIPVNSHNGQGLAAVGLARDAKRVHAIVYNDDTEPHELPDEPRMKMHSIGLALQDSQGCLNRGSRANFGAIRRIRSNIHLCNLGQVNGASLPYFRKYAHDAMRSRTEVAS